MTSFYGSQAIPREVFGEGRLLSVFYDTMKERAPGAWEINEALLAIWDPTKLIYSWVLPDNFHVHIKVMGKVSETVHFLNEPFEVDYRLNMPVEGGRSLSANMVHSVDGMIVREMQRRCNYDPAVIDRATHLTAYGSNHTRDDRKRDQMVKLLWKHFEDTGFLSVRILDHLDNGNFGLVDREKITSLLNSLPTKPFEIMTVHDCFRCLPNYGNDLRQQYNNILAEIAESDLLSSLVSQMTGRTITVDKYDSSLGSDIRHTNYALS